MRAARILVLAALLPAVGATLAGCGSSGDRAAAFPAAYRASSAQVRTIGEQVTAALGAAGGQDDAVVAATFTRLAARARTTARGLRALPAPADARAATLRLAAAVDRAAVDLAAIAAAARAGDVRAAGAASEAVVTDSLPIREARVALDRIVAAP